MRNFLCPVCLLLTCVMPVFSAPVAANEQRPIMLMRSLPSGQVPAVGGFLRERYVDSFRKGLLKADWERLVALFEAKNYTGDDPVGGEMGKWLSAAAYTASRVGDAKLRNAVDQAVRGLEKSQEADGYLGVSAPSVRQPLRALEPYEHYWLLQGLLDCHEQLASDLALRVASRLAGFYLEHFGPTKLSLAAPDLCTSPDERASALRATVLIEPLARLSAETGDERLVKWCLWVVENLDAWSGADFYTGLSCLGTGEAKLEDVTAYLDPETFYLNLLGLLQIYAVTGEATCLRPVESAWEALAADRLALTGADPQADTSACLAWLRLNQRLLEVTGKTRYADVVEKLLWNVLPAAQSGDGGNYVSSRPLAGTRPPLAKPADANAVSSGVLALALLPSLICAEGPEGYYINQYCESTVRFRAPSGQIVTLEQHTSYPDTEAVAIVLRMKKPETLNFLVRIPGWAEGATVRVNYWMPSPATSGGYECISRKWSDGEMIHVRFPMRPCWVKGAGEKEGLVALVRGPVVFALNSLWCSAEARLALFDSRERGTAFTGLAWVFQDTWLTRQPAKDGALGPFYPVKLGMKNGAVHEGCMVPFANVGLLPEYKQADNSRTSADSGEDCEPDSGYAYAVWLPAEPDLPQAAPSTVSAVSGYL